MKGLSKMIAIKEKDWNFETSSLDKITEYWKNISHHYNISWRDSFVKWELPKNLPFDFAVTLAFPISRSLKKSSYEVALEIKKMFLSFAGNKLDIFVTEQGYLNCNLSNSFYMNNLNCLNSNDLCFKKKKKNIKVNIEFVSVNPTGYLHLGHLRNAVIGDTLANIYEFLGYEVTREYYVNDRGNQIKSLLQSVLLFYAKKENVNVNISEETANYKGGSTEDASSYLSKNGFISTDSENWNLKNLEDRIISFFTDKIKRDLMLCGVSFDNWFSEKKMYEDFGKIKKLLESFETKGLTYNKDGALFLKTELFNDDKDRVIIKENGDYTYFFSDIVYHLDKLDRSDILINVWGSDHHGYIPRLISSLTLLGYDVKDRIFIVLIQMVSLLTNEGNKKFSKRLGNSIDVDETLKVLKKDQLRFCLLEKESNHSLLINLEMLTQQNENSRLYYVQYAHVRCNQILKKWGSLEENDNVLFIRSPFLLEEKKEKNIIINLVRFSQVIFESADQKKPFLIIHYLQALSKEFQSYYQSYSILQNNDKGLSKQRLALVNAVKKTLSEGLVLCGIDPLEFMN